MVRPRVRRELEREFWEQVPWWPSLVAAGAAVGVSEGTAKWWVRQSGGVKPRLSAPTRRLSYRERCRIEELLRAGCAPAGIARLLGRARSSISRELARCPAGRYRAVTANGQAVTP